MLDWHSPARAAWIPAVLLTVPLLIPPALLCAFRLFSLLPWLLPPIAIAAGAAVVYARLYTASCRGEWRDGQIAVVRGVLWRREWHIAQSAVRGLGSVEPPLHRLLSCRTLRLQYAGGSVLIPLVGLEQARQLQALFEVLS